MSRQHTNPPKGTKHRIRHHAARGYVSPTTNRRRPLDDAEIQGLVELVEARSNLKLHQFQLDAVIAQLQMRDVVVHAGTGSGKTAIAAAPHVHPSSKGKVTIMVSPLIALHNEQVETFQNEFKLTATAINSAHGGCTFDKLHDVIEGKWQIVVISPEMLLSDRFIAHVLRDPRFGARVLSVVIDEAHVVSHWGSGFRKAYGNLGMVRAFLPRGTPVVALSATLPSRVRRDVLSKLQFGRDYLDLDIGNERTNVSLVVRAIQSAMNTYADLDFLIKKNGLNTPDEIKKTFIYADSISIGTDIIDHLTELLPAHMKSLGLIRPFNAALGKDYRKAAMEAFKCGDIRILVCTDAAGMGCNIPDIDVVVQWKLPDSLSAFVQRAGRAARKKDRQGLAILLVEPSHYKVDLLKPKDKPADNQKVKANAKKNQAGGGGKVAKAYAVQHGVKRGSRTGTEDKIHLAEQPPLDVDAEDEGLLVLVQTGICRRKVMREVYGNAEQDLTVPCCDLCNPNLFNHVRPGVPPKVKRQKKIKRGDIVPVVQAELDAWRDEIWEQDFVDSIHGSDVILSNDLLDLLSSVGPITTLAALEGFVGAQWPFYEKYGRSLLEKMVAIEYPEVDISTEVRGQKRGHGDPEEDIDAPDGTNGGGQAGTKRTRVERDATHAEAILTTVTAEEAPGVPSTFASASVALTASARRRESESTNGTHHGLAYGQPASAPMYHVPYPYFYHYPHPPGTPLNPIQGASAPHFFYPPTPQSAVPPNFAYGHFYHTPQPLYQPIQQPTPSSSAPVAPPYYPAPPAYPAFASPSSPSSPQSSERAQRLQQETPSRPEPPRTRSKTAQSRSTIGERPPASR